MSDYRDDGIKSLRSIDREPPFIIDTWHDELGNPEDYGYVCDVCQEPAKKAITFTKDMVLDRKVERNEHEFYCEEHFYPRVQQLKKLIIKDSNIDRE